MASSPIRQRITLDGDAEVRAQLDLLAQGGARAFDAIGEAARGARQPIDSIGTASQRAAAAVVPVSAGMARLGDAAEKASDGTKTLSVSLAEMGSKASAAASSAQSAAGQVANLGASLATFAKSLGIGLGVLAGLGAGMLALAKNAATLATAIDKAADKSGAGLEDFQKLRRIFEQIAGGDTEAADAAIKKFGDGVESARDKAAAIQAEVQKFGTTFPNAAAAIENAARSSTKFKTEIGDGDAVLSKFSGALTVAKLKLFAEAMTQAGDKAADLAKAIGPGIGDVLARLATELSAGSVKADQLAASLSFFKNRGLDPDKLKDFVEELAKISDPAQRADRIKEIVAELPKLANEAAQTKLAVAAFGDVIGKALVEAIKEAGAAIDKFNPKRVVESDAVDNAKKLLAALQELSRVKEVGQVEFGNLFTPAATAAVEQFTKLLKDNRGTILEWAAAIRDKAVAALVDFFALLRGAPDAQIGTKGLITFRDTIVDIGAAIKTTFFDVIVPGFQGLGPIIDAALKPINEFFGSQLSTAQVVVGAVIASLIGGFNSLAIAVLAVFGGNTTPAIDNFKDKIKSIGIDLDAIKAKAKELFDDLIAALRDPKADLKNSWIRDVADAIKSLPAIIVGVSAAFLALRTAANLLAPLISRVIGKEVNGDAVLLIATIGQFTGIFTTLTTILVGTAAASTLLLNGFTLISAALTAIAGLIGWPAVLIGGMALLLTNLNTANSAFDLLASALNKLFNTSLNGSDILVSVLGGAFALLVAQINPVAGAVVALGTALLVLSGHADDVVKVFGLVKDGAKSAKDEVQVFIDKINAQTQGQPLLQLPTTWQQLWESAIGKVKDLLGNLSFVTPAKAATDEGGAPGLGGPGAEIFDRLGETLARARDAAELVFSQISADALNAANAIVAAFQLAGQRIPQVLGAGLGAGGGSAAAQPVGGEQAAASGDQQAQGGLFSAIVVAATEAVGQIAAAFAALDGQLGALFQAEAAAIQGMFSGIGNFINDITAQALAQIQTLVAALQQLIATAQSAAAATAATGTITGQKFAHGGLVLGPGSSTSDSILARLSRGEFVINARAVSHFGPEFFAALNALRAPGFSMGGMVDSFATSFALPRLAGGGMIPDAAVASPGRNLGTLLLRAEGGANFTVFTDDDTAQSLTRYASRAGIRSGGRKPVFY